MNDLIQLLKDYPAPVLVTTVILVVAIVPVAIMATWWLGRKLKGIEKTQCHHHTQLNARIDNLAAQHDELRATINTRFDDFRNFITAMFEREDPKQSRRI